MPDPDNATGLATRYWAGTIVAMSKVRIFHPDSLTLKLCRLWYDGDQPKIKTLSQMSYAPFCIRRLPPSRGEMIKFQYAGGY